MEVPYSHHPLRPPIVTCQLRGEGGGRALSKGSATESNLRENINVRFKVGSVYLVYGQPGGWGGGCEKRGFPERVILIWCFYPGMIQCGRTDSVKGCSE